jgi:lysophospholipid acyltransferase (LPLAT)-like uncharacterized protein
MADARDKIANAPPGTMPAPESAVEAETAKNARTFTRWERVQIFFATWFGYFAVLLIGRTLRWEIIGWENYEAARKLGKSFIFTFWHCGIFSATWFWRKRGIVVMASQNFDGEYIARIIKKHGYNVARGSSSRSASRVLVEMIRALRNGHEAAVTVDGPRGPRHIAKPGVVLLSKATGAAILCFHIVPRRAWVLRKSWDRTEIPYLFTRAAIFIAPPLVVPAEAGDDEQVQKLHEVQETLEGLVRQGEAWLEKAKTAKAMAKVG